VAPDAGDLTAIFRDGRRQPVIVGERVFIPALLALVQLLPVLGLRRQQDSLRSVIGGGPLRFEETEVIVVRCSSH
jgi:hypothetical protein